MRTFVRFVEVSVLRVAEQVIDLSELVSRVMKDDGQEQIVQMVKVVPPERPSERVVEQIGGCIPQQMEEETQNVVQIFPQERGQTLERGAGGRLSRAAVNPSGLRLEADGAS